MSLEVRSLLREYAPSDQAPLAGYGAAITVYAVGLCAALALARRTRRVPSFMDLVLLGAATHKLSRIVAKDFVTAPLRAPFTRRKAVEGAGEVQDEPRGGPLRRAVGNLLTCPYCLGVWISTALNTVLLLRPAETRLLLRILASDTISDFLHVSYSHLNESRKVLSAERRQAVAALDG
jgi:hypothetical protein